MVPKSAVAALSIRMGSSMNATSDMSDIGSLIGQRLRAARTRARMSRRELAAVADVSERYLVQLEAGEANVSIGVLARVAGALSLDLPSLLAAGAVAPLQPAGIAEPLAHVISTMSLREQEAAAPVLKQYLEDRRRSMHGVALLGLRGAGKSTIGNLFAARHGMAFISVTREVEARAGMSLADLFNLGGPDAYRTLENEVVTDLARRNERIVLETAGGIVSNKEALDVILGAYKTVWLKASPQEHLDRVIKQGDMRPMHGAPKALEHLKSLLAQRQPEYERADFVLDTNGHTPEECVDMLERIVGFTGRQAGP